MKHAIRLLIVFAITGTAFAQVDPQRPMVTGKGNVDARPEKVVVTNQTAASPESEVVVLENLVVTGSLIPKADAPEKPARRVHLKQR